MSYLLKSPDGVCNLTQDWSSIIGEATIENSAWAGTPSGLSFDDDQNGQETSALTSGGSAGIVYSVVNTIMTSDGQTLEKLFALRVEAAANGV